MGMNLTTMDDVFLKIGEMTSKEKSALKPHQGHLNGNFPNKKEKAYCIVFDMQLCFLFGPIVKYKRN